MDTTIQLFGKNRIRSGVYYKSPKSIQFITGFNWKFTGKDFINIKEWLEDEYNLEILSIF